MRKLRKATAFMLAAIMMLSTVVGNTVQAETSETTGYQALVLEQQATVTVDETNREAYFSFTPETSAIYIFRSINGEFLDPKVDLYEDALGQNHLAYNDDGSNLNFQLSYSMEAGTTYYFQISHWNDSQCGTYQVELFTPPAVASAEFAPIEIIEHSDGYWDQPGTEYEYFHYNRWDSRIPYTITMKDGSVIEGTGNGFEYQGLWYSFETSSNQSFSNPWTVGNTYTVTVHVFGFENEVQISIVEPPVQSVSIEPISIIENWNGNWNTDYDGNEFFWYSWSGDLTYTVIMKDGQVITGTDGSGFEYDGQYYSFICTDDQYSNPWKVNNTYTATASILGYETEVQVSVVETPVQNIVMQPISILENSGGYLSNEGSEYEYYHYWWYHKMDFVITMKDGQVITRENATSFEYNGTWMSFDWIDTQSSSSPWTIGNTYTQTVSVLGYETTVDVSIIDTPIQSVEVEPITIMEGTNGYLSNGRARDWFYYYNWSNCVRNYTITMKDGTVYTSSTNGGPVPGVQYDGEWYHFTQIDDQNTNPWTPGNTYTATLNIMGYNADVEVTIEESPIESVAVEALTIAEHTNGSWYSSGPIGPGGPAGPTGTDSWYYYCWNNLLQYTITLKDGRVLQGTGTGVNIDGQHYSFSYMDSQHNEHWYAGNTYTVSMTFLGKQVDANVSICEKNQTDGFEYLVQDGSAIIIGCSKEEAILNIPSVIDGYPVIGITDLTYAVEYAEELVIPDSVTMLSGSLFEWNYSLKKLTLGSGISNINNDMFMGANELEAIVVSDNNSTYCSVDGVVYDKEMKTLVVFPRGKSGAYTVPDTVEDIECLIDNISYYDIQLDLGNSKTDYTVEDGVIYNADKTVIYACDRTKTGKYVMPDTVTTIKEGAFQECSFSEVVVSENVSEIVYAAFSYSMELEKVVLPEKLKTIGTAAFVECEKLVEADLPSGLEELEDQAFYKTGITNVTIPGTVTQVGYSAYKESKVAELTLEEGIEVVWSGAFAYTQLKSVVIPNSITHMGASVFAATPLERVTIGTGLETIPDYAFAGTQLTTVTIPENIFEIGEYAFANSPLEEAIIEKNDVYIWDGAFYNCPLKEIDLKDGVIAVSDYAFYGNDAEGVVIPDSVTDVTYKSFAESKKLLDIDVPDDLASIDGTAFDGTAWWDAQDDGVVYLENYLYGYKGKMPENTEITVKDGTTLIADYAFNNEHNLKTLSIPSSVVHIGRDALEGCIGLEKVTIAEGNPNYKTNDEGTILLYEDQYTSYLLWEKVEEVYWFEIDPYVGYGMSAETWLANNPWQYVDVEYASGWVDRETCAVTADMVSGFDSTKPGWHTITVDFGKFICESEIHVEMPEITGIKVSKLPDKIEYDLNQELETTGMIVKAITGSGTEFEIEDYAVYGFDSSEAGRKTVTIAYMGVETTFEVEVIDGGGEDVPTPPTEPEEDVTIKKVSIKSLPRKTTYELGETIDLDGLTVLVSYSDGSSEILHDGFIVSGFNSNVAGEQTVIITHEEKDISVEFVVTINEPVEVPEIQKAEVMIGNATGKPGDEVQISVSFKEEVTIKSIAISDLEYDKEKLELVNVEWDVTGILSDWGTIAENAGVLTFTNNTAVKGNVLTFTFRILDDVADGTCEIACQVIANEMLESGEEQNLDVTVTFGEITIKNVLKGDVNDDGYVTSDDAIYLLYHTTNNVVYPINQDGDFDGDGHVTSDDAIYLLYYVMMPEKYPIYK